MQGLDVAEKNVTDVCGFFVFVFVCVSHQTNKCVFSLGRDCFQKNSVHIVFDNYNVAFATCS